MPQFAQLIMEEINCYLRIEHGMRDVVSLFFLRLKDGSNQHFFLMERTHTLYGIVKVEILFSYVHFKIKL